MAVGILTHIRRLPRLRQLVELLQPPAPDPARQAERLRVVERDIMLPIKAVFMLLLTHYLYFTKWMWLDSASSSRDVALETIQSFFMIYAGVNVGVAFLLYFMQRLPLPLVQWAIFISGLLDGLLIAALTLITNGFDSILYWFFPALILRNALAIPLATQQLMLNFTVSLCYLFAGLLDVTINQISTPLFNENTMRALELGNPDNPTEPFVLRLMVLFFMTMVCYGLQMLFEKERVAREEGREFALRQEQLNSAGRLAAEIAHQIKNPLAIINNAAFNLQRALPKEKESIQSQVQIIREEVDRADRVLTELMGYSKLSDARVERLDLTEEVERAIGQVFPSGSYETRVIRHFIANLPPLMMQRGHLSEIFVNIFTNAREAMQGGGQIDVYSRLVEPHSIEVTIADTGPGIAPDRLERIFEAYYTTKTKGTGLGLAIVRHSMDIYGGKVEVQSELGKGARFILHFPTKLLNVVT